MSQPATAAEAAKQVLAGDPRATARAWLWPVVVAVAILFAFDTYLVATRPLLPFDIPVAHFVQTFPWGPVAYVFDLINATAGYVQVAVGVIAVVVVFMWEPRALSQRPHDVHRHGDGGADARLADRWTAPSSPRPKPSVARPEATA